MTGVPQPARWPQKAFPQGKLEDPLAEGPAEQRPGGGRRAPRPGQCVLVGTGLACLMMSWRPTLFCAWTSTECSGAIKTL